MKILIVYNTCGIGGNENFSYYIDAIFSLLNQTFPAADRKLVLSACKMGDFAKSKMVYTFKKDISYNFIEDSLPLGITFNFTVQKMFEQYGRFDAVLYVDSGIHCWRDDMQSSTAIQSMWDTFQIRDAAMVSTLVSNDHGFQWWGIQPKLNEIFQMPIGKATNLHFQLFSGEIYDTFNRQILPTIFANDTSESTFTMLCAVIGKPWFINGYVNVMHNHSMDGASIGWQGPLLFKTEKTLKEICDKGKEFGFGYEEYNPKIGRPHDPTQFDKNGLALNPGLLGFIRENLYLQKEFDYGQITHKFYAN